MPPGALAAWQPSAASSSAAPYAGGSGCARRRSPPARRPGLSRCWRSSSPLARAGRGCSETFFSWEHAKAVFPADPRRLLAQREAVPDRRGRSSWCSASRSRWRAPRARRGWRRSGSPPCVYTDLFRGIPTILLVLLLGFGVPALQLQGLTNDPFFWAGVALVLSYGAYVAEVFRAGIDSIHPPRSPAPTRSASRDRRRCGTSSCRRRYAASYPRCSTTSSRCRRTPRWCRRWRSSTRCSRRATTRPSTSTTRRSSWSPASSSC